MDYDINELLFKMGISELSEKGSLRWHYMDASDPEISGFADARFEEGGRRLVIELRHTRKDIVDDEGEVLEHSVESVQIGARRIGNSELFRITKLSFDGTEHPADNAAMLELCCGIFYARALEISEIMTKQRFKADEAPVQTAEDRIKAKRAMRKEATKSVFQKADEVMGVIIPFKPRKDAPVQRI